MSANPNHQFFDGFYQEIWQQLMPAQLTNKEVAHLIGTYGLSQQTPVLDLMCGQGRHALALARSGIPVTAVDNLASYVQPLTALANQESLPLRAICENLLDWVPLAGHHWALCMGNSLNFFSPEELPVVLQKVSDSLVDGGYFWVNSWSIAEIILPQELDGQSSTATVGRFQHTNRFAIRYNPLRLEIESRIEDENGQVEEKIGIDFLFSVEELRELLAAAGLRLMKVESVPGKRNFQPGAPRVYLLSQKQVLE